MQTVGPFECGMPRPVQQLASLKRSILERVLSIAYSPDGRHIISGSEDKTVRIWDAETGAAVGKPLEGHTGWVQFVTYSPNGQRLSPDPMTRPFESGMP
jgi:WD40 repeat protein